MRGPSVKQLKRRLTYSRVTCSPAKLKLFESKHYLTFSISACVAHVRYRLRAPGVKFHGQLTFAAKI
jgi:hypothetical protein